MIKSKASLIYFIIVYFLTKNISKNDTVGNKPESFDVPESVDKIFVEIGLISLNIFSMRILFWHKIRENALHCKHFVSEYVDSNLYETTMPDDHKMNEIKRNFNGGFKCQATNYHWTAWSSSTSPSNVDSYGNDYELLEIHRALNSR